ncbi:MAG: selenocysteine-specific translation elongation factor, partial [Pyrinomonadaceae bacterium]|nr:selenocysteine-specific translation elongation factor [Pyrinomonadaceae bacterium]
MEIIVGTAGHIDHGKTSLIRALTGTDADRLPEEKQRGITIDIGFAELSIGNNHFGFVDVPGHERFVKNMLAGASGIDLVLLVVAADEGVMPQTREHFEICRLLGLTHGIVVLTKADRVDEETLELARLDVADLVVGSFLEGAPVVAVSSVTGQGIEELKAELVRSAAMVTGRDASRVTLLPIDRSFSVKGFGAVTTGTLASGDAAEGSELDLFPAGRRVRVRGVQIHGRKVAAAHAGQRTALNLGGIDYSEIERGMVLAEPGTIRPTQIFAAEVEVLRDAPRPLRTRQRVRVHIGTAEVLARVFVVNEASEIAPGDSGLVQLSVETPVIALMGDRFIVRSYSPQMTIAGGSVVLPSIEKLRRRDIPAASAQFGQILAARGDAAQTVRLLIERSDAAGTTFSDLQSATGWKRDTLSNAITETERAGSIARTGERYLAAEVFGELQDETLRMLTAFHEKEPLAPGLSREAIR